MAAPMVKLTMKATKAVERIKETGKKSLGKKYVDIGIKGGQYPSDSSKGGKPLPMATLAAYLEYGWAQTVTPKQTGFFLARYGIDIQPGMHLVNPPRPFLRGTAAAEGENWKKLFAAVIKARGIQALPDALQFVGERAQQDVMQTIANNGTSKQAFPPRSELTRIMYGLDDQYTESGNERRRDGTGGQDREQALVRKGILHKSIGYWMRND